ncbi:MAG: hypothetical protein JSS72_07415 [Armatimonadetes bacterium]|nr:hypothetical protein [Armatimonadota bacterium]
MYSDYSLLDDDDTPPRPAIWAMVVRLSFAFSALAKLMYHSASDPIRYTPTTYAYNVWRKNTYVYGGSPESITLLYRQPYDLNPELSDERWKNVIYRVRLASKFGRIGQPMGYIQAVECAHKDPVRDWGGNRVRLSVSNGPQSEACREIENCFEGAGDEFVPGLSGLKSAYTPPPSEDKRDFTQELPGLDWRNLHGQAHTVTITPPPAFERDEYQDGVVIAVYAEFANNRDMDAAVLVENK